MVRMTPRQRVSSDVSVTARDLGDCASQRDLPVHPAKPCSPGLTPGPHCLSLSSQGHPSQAQERPLTLQIRLLKHRLQDALACRTP